MSRHAALACAVLLAVSAIATAAPTTPTPTTPVIGRPRKAADPAAKTESITKALSGQPDLSTFAAALKFVGADDEFAAATNADVIVYAPTNAAFDAFAKEMMPGNSKATGKDLLQPQYLPLLTHVLASHVTEDDDNDGVYRSFANGQALLLEADDAGAGEGDDDGYGDDDGPSEANNNSTAAPEPSSPEQSPEYLGTVQVLPSKKVSANLVRELDLGDAGDIYVVDRVLTPDNVYATPTAAFRADPELATYGRLIKALAPEVVRRADGGAPATAFVPTSNAMAKYLSSAGLTEAKVLSGSPELKASVTGTLVYHVVPGIGLDTAALAGSDWTLKTALVVGPAPARASGDKLSAADVVKTLKVPKAVRPADAVVVEGDLGSKGKVLSQVYAGSEVIHKVDAVLVPSVGGGAGSGAAKQTPTATLPASSSKPTAAAVAPRSSSSGRKLLRSATRNNIAANTQRANIRRAMSGSLTVGEATALNGRVAALAPIGSIPTYFLTSGASNGGGAFYG